MLYGLNGGLFGAIGGNCASKTNDFFSCTDCCNSRKTLERQVKCYQRCGHVHPPGLRGLTTSSGLQGLNSASMQQTNGTFDNYYSYRSRMPTAGYTGWREAIKQPSTQTHDWRTPEREKKRKRIKEGSAIHRNAPPAPDSGIGLLQVALLGGVGYFGYKAYKKYEKKKV